MSVECQDTQRCGSESEMLSAPSVGSNQAADSFWAKGACGVTLLAAGTYDECGAAAMEHRNEVRASLGLEPMGTDTQE